MENGQVDSRSFGHLSGRDPRRTEDFTDTNIYQKRQQKWISTVATWVATLFQLDLFEWKKRPQSRSTASFEARSPTSLRLTGKMAANLVR